MEVSWHAMWHSMNAQQVGYRLSWVAMLIRVVALGYAFGVLSFYPHPIIAARSELLMGLWVIAAGYTAVLIMVLALPINPWLRTTPFIMLDTAIALALVNLAGGGYRNIFSLYSLIPSVTAALSLPSAEHHFRRAILLGGVVVASTFGFGLSLYLDGYTPARIIELRQVDEVVLRSASYWVTGGLLAALAAMMIAWQHSRDRANALREQSAIEEERRRIATDIHDGVLSQLSALSRRAEYASLLLAEDPKGAQEELHRVITMAGEVHEGIRWIVRALRQDPTQLTLGEELMRIAERFQHNTELPVLLKLPRGELPVPVDAVRHVGYIVTEALTNIWKHAHANRAVITVRRVDGQVLVKVADDGCGFDVAQTLHAATGMGLRNMRERAQEIGAELTLRSAPGKGCQVLIALPVSQEEDGGGIDAGAGVDRG
ncbi:MAG: sensor histidine kinase [Anaerolineae bacterium]|nr:sensor histidine kinase [Anaerolineae bacterium]MDW8069907.1 sensor histidine kinase [Anaerolineae bacterium]